MRTEHVKYLLPDYATGKLDEAVHKLVTEHLKTCDLCRSDFEEIGSVLAQVRTGAVQRPTAAYFSSLVPRIRQRLEGKRSVSWLVNPFATKLVLPFSVAVLAITLLLNLRLTEEEPANPLKNFMADFAVEDVIDIISEAAQPTFWTTKQAQEIVEKLVAGHVSEGHALTYVLEADPEEGMEHTKQLLRELDESEIQQLLQKLGERTIL